MKKAEHFYKRLESAADEGMVEYNKGDEKAVELLEKTIKGPAKYPRLVAALSLIKEIAPKTLGEKIAKKLDVKDFSDLPFDPKKLELKEKIGAGYISKVYLLEAKLEDQPSYVLKIDSNKPGETSDLHEYAKQNHQDYERIRGYYAELPELIPQEISIIMTNRKDKRPVIATVQKFIGRNLRDVFTDFSREELMAILRENQQLMNEFKKFTELSLAFKEEYGEAVDLLGEKNLVIVDKEGKLSLKFLDPHLISSLDSDEEWRNEKLEEALNYLESVSHEIDETQLSEAA